MVYDSGFLWLTNQYHKVVSESAVDYFGVKKFSTTINTVVSTFNLNSYGYPANLTTNGTYVWVAIQSATADTSGALGNTVIKLNYDNTYNSTITFQPSSRPFGISHDDKYIWISFGEINTISKVDITTNDIISNILITSNASYNSTDSNFCWVLGWNVGIISQILTKTNYQIADGTDLIDIFAPLNGVTPSTATNYEILYSTGMPIIDLNTIFAPYTSGTQAPATNYLIPDTTPSSFKDLNTVFSPLIKYTTTGSPIITSGTVNGTSYNNIITFNSSGSITFLVSNIAVNYFLVGGGGTGGLGAGGSAEVNATLYGGGGGAGKINNASFASLSQTYTISIGGSATQSSIISPSLSVISSAGGNGANASEGGPTGSGAGGASGNGFSGGNEITIYDTTSAGGGGGGSTGNGFNATNPGETQEGPVYFGVGGSGTLLNINGVSNTYGIGGNGGGFNGYGTVGLPNTGNGGQGNTRNTYVPVAGGSGILILSFNTP